MIDRSDLFLDEKERLMGQAEVTKSLWQDEVQERFYERFVDKAILSVDHYLDGCDGYIGMGLRELTSFVKKLISLKREHPVFSNRLALKGQDYTGQGLPDISFHGIKAWMPDYGYYSRTLGIFLNGRYALKDKRTADSSFFLLVNMHWESHEFDLPTIDEHPYTMVLASEDSAVSVGERTCVLEGRSAVLFKVETLAGTAQAGTGKPRRERKKV